MGLAAFMLFFIGIGSLGFGFLIVTRGFALVVYGITGIKKPEKIKSPKSKPLLITAIITGAIVIIIGLAIAVGFGIIICGGLIVDIFEYEPSYTQH